MSNEWFTSESLSKSIRHKAEPRTTFKKLLGIPEWDPSKYIPPSPEAIAERERKHKEYEAKLQQARDYLDELGVYPSELCDCEEEW